MVIFHCYVSLPEGINEYHWTVGRWSDSALSLRVIEDWRGSLQSIYIATKGVCVTMVESPKWISHETNSKDTLKIRNQVRQVLFPSPWAADLGRRRCGMAPDFLLDGDSRIFNTLGHWVLFAEFLTDLEVMTRVLKQETCFIVFLPDSEPLIEAGRTVPCLLKIPLSRTCSLEETTWPRTNAECLHPSPLTRCYGRAKPQIEILQAFLSKALASKWAICRTRVVRLQAGHWIHAELLVCWGSLWRYWSCFYNIWWSNDIG